MLKKGLKFQRQIHVVARPDIFGGTKKRGCKLNNHADYFGHAPRLEDVSPPVSVRQPQWI